MSDNLEVSKEKTKYSNEFKIAIFSIAASTFVSVCTVKYNNDNMISQMHLKQQYEIDAKLELRKCDDLKEIITGLSGLQLKQMQGKTSSANALEMSAYNRSLIFMPIEKRKEMAERQDYFDGLLIMLQSASKEYIGCL